MPNPNFKFEAVLAPGGVAVDESLIKSIELSYSRPEDGRMVHYYTITKTYGDPQTLAIIDGKDGEQGNGITEIEYLYSESSTQGMRDTYEIHFTDGTSYQFSIMNGKSAYLYAKDGGYTGTETEFAAKLALEHPSWALQATKPAYTASEVGADALGTAATVLGNHNTSAGAHMDIRTALQTLMDQVDAVLNSDDKTLDELKEIVAYIKANRTLIENVTDTKVNVADIINNLVTNVANKPLSAAQGVALKALIDAITIPTKVSAFTNDAGYLTSVPSQYVTETELNQKGYLTQHQDISGKADKSSAETWTFKLKDGSTVTKKVVLA